jgi:hypothetical protein
MFDQFLGQKTNIFRTYSEVPRHFPDTFDDKFRTVFFHRVGRRDTKLLPLDAS